MRTSLAWFALIAVGGGLYLLLASATIAGALCVAGGVALLWLCGMWVLPWTRDGYLRRVYEVARRWGENAQWAYDVSRRHSARLRGALLRLAPPPAFEGDHQRLLELLGSDEGDLPFSQRVRARIDALADVESTVQLLRSAASTPEERRYCRAVEIALKRGRGSYEQATRRAERASHEAARRFAHMRPPAEARAEQARLAEAFREYLAASETFHRACLDRDARRAALAADGMQSARQELTGAMSDLRQRLDYAARWPARGGRS